VQVRAVRSHTVRNLDTEAMEWHCASEVNGTVWNPGTGGVLWSETVRDPDTKEASDTTKGGMTPQPTDKEACGAATQNGSRYGHGGVLWSGTVSNQTRTRSAVE
jgi:hypothetical protein